MEWTYVDKTPVIDGVRQYCHACCGCARKAGRVVRKTDLGGNYCQPCENRAREGLVHYIPSNGTEGDIFMARCERCRHASEHPDGYMTCAFKILDRVMETGWVDRDDGKTWFDPADLRKYDAAGRYLCPAECQRFTDKRDPDGERRDPPRPDCEGQMAFSDLDVPVERVPVRATQGAPA